MEKSSKKTNSNIDEIPLEADADGAVKTTTTLHTIEVDAEYMADLEIEVMYLREIEKAARIVQMRYVRSDFWALKEALEAWDKRKGKKCRK